MGQAMQVFVRRPNGKELVFDVRTSTSVEDVSACVCDRMDTPPGASVRLTFKGRMLEPSLTLERAGVDNLSTLHLLLRIPQPHRLPIEISDCCSREARLESDRFADHRVPRVGVHQASL